MNIRLLPIFVNFPFRKLLFTYVIKKNKFEFFIDLLITIYYNNKQTKH